MSNPGLCATCVHCRLVQTARSTFYLCERSFTDASFRKYPRLPVTTCRGYEPLPERDAPASDPDSPRE